MPSAQSHSTPGGERVATASQDHTARIWDAATGQQIGDAFSHEESVQSVVFSADGTRLLTAGLDGTARLWDAGPREGPPAWFIEFAEQFAGFKIAEDGKPARIAPGRPALPTSGPEDSWTQFATWLLKSGPEKTINPRSRRTMREYP